VGRSCPFSGDVNGINAVTFGLFDSGILNVQGAAQHKGDAVVFAQVDDRVTGWILSRADDDVIRKGKSLGTPQRVKS